PITYSPSGTFPLSATGGGSGNAVTFSTTTPAICSTGGTNGTTVTILSAGTCVLKADQAGNTNYSAAPQASASVVIEKATSTITWANPADITYLTALGATQLNATASVSGA